VAGLLPSERSKLTVNSYASSCHLCRCCLFSTIHNIHIRTLLEKLIFILRVADIRCVLSAIYLFYVVLITNISTISSIYYNNK
jgi:hypothetical protein